LTAIIVVEVKLQMGGILNAMSARQENFLLLRQDLPAATVLKDSMPTPLQHFVNSVLWDNFKDTRLDQPVSYALQASTLHACKAYPAKIASQVDMPCTGGHIHAQLVQLDSSRKYHRHETVMHVRVDLLRRIRTRQSAINVN
jgi:hypothetical protein